MSEEYFFIPLSRKQIAIIKNALEEAERLSRNMADNVELEQINYIQKTWLDIMSAGWTRAYNINWPENDMSAEIEKQTAELYDKWMER